MKLFNYFGGENLNRLVHMDTILQIKISTSNRACWCKDNPEGDCQVCRFVDPTSLHRYIGALEADGRFLVNVSRTILRHPGDLRGVLDSQENRTSNRECDSATFLWFQPMTLKGLNLRNDRFASS